MKIVIDIDDIAYKFVQNTSFVEDESTMFEQTSADRKKTLFLFGILDAIKNGTPLPKGHGRLVDISKIDKDRIESDNPIIYLTVNGQYTEAISLDYLNALSTIIEADKESEDKE